MSFLHGAGWLWIIPILSLLVFVHELGHFWVARRVGIRVREFGFGYPPRMFAVRRGETDYSVNWIPVGGFTRMVGEDEATSEGGSFSSKSRAQRAAVLVAGSAMNFLLAPILLALLFMYGVPVPDQVKIVGILPDSPAAAAGLRPGDILLEADGQPIVHRETFQALVQSHGNQPLRLTLDRGGNRVEVEVTPRVNPERNVPQVGVSMEQLFVTRAYAPWTALWLGVRQSVETFVDIWAGLFFMVQQALEGGGQPMGIMGPIGIAQTTGEVARLGFSMLVQFTAGLSINLAIINLLPIPALDGGRLLFLGIEMIRGRQMDARREGYVHLVGMALLLTLIVIISSHDIRRLLMLK